jgi:4-phytase/acid phosphatase
LPSTSIANLAALLDLHWQLPEYPQDDMPPGDALVFELRQGPNHQPSVDAFFAAQSPDAMRNHTDTAPDHVPVKTRPCPPGGQCAMADFVVPLAQFIAMTTPILGQNRGCLTD